MTTDSDKCSFSSLLPMSCRRRAEAFAQRLNSRLRSLSSHDGVADETSWLAANENPLALSQPRQSSENDLFYDFGLPESPSSPEEDLREFELSSIITSNSSTTKNKLKAGKLAGDVCKCQKVPEQNTTNVTAARSTSFDSDSSEGQYYDLDTDDDKKSYVNGYVIHDENGELEESREDVKPHPMLANYVEESPTTDSLMHSEEESTLSLQDYLSLECFSSSQDMLPLEDTSEQKSINGEVNERSFYDTGCLCSQNLEVSPDDGDDLENDASQDETDKRISVDEERNQELVEFLLDEDLKTCDSNFPSPRINLTNQVTPGDQVDEEEITVEVIRVSSTAKDNCVLERSGTPEESYLSSLRIDRDLMVDVTTHDDTSGVHLTNQIELRIQVDDLSEHDEPVPRVRRCSSLKTGKTPPGTPGRKKIVRFADVLGLDLADVRTFLDEIPKVPTSAYSDLVDADFCSALSDNSTDVPCENFRHPCSKIEKILMPLFQQPGGQADFIDRVREGQVCLENAVVDDPVALSIKGTVRVRNLDYNKSVHLRYSLDSWRSFSDLQATYVVNSCDGFSDKFSFLLYANTVAVGQRLEFAVRFQCKGCQYWDSNKGANYCFQCLPSSSQQSYTPITGMEDHWGAAFYYSDSDPEGNVLKGRSFGRDDRLIAVQEYVTKALDRNDSRKRPLGTGKNSPDYLTVVVVIVFSVLFLYIQKAIYFTQ